MKLCKIILLFFLTALLNAHAGVVINDAGSPNIGSMGGVSASDSPLGAGEVCQSTSTTACAWSAVAGGGDMLGANNLSDVASATTSRSNIGIKQGLVSALPGTCTIGERYLATDATAGLNEYRCTATNTWVQEIGLSPTGIGSDLTLNRIAGSTYSTVQHWRNNLSSSGVVAGGVITDAGAGNINVASGQGILRSSDSNTAALYFADWPASNGLAIPNNTTRFIGVEYNAGTPQVTVRTTDNWNYHTDFQLGTVHNESGVLHVQIADKHLISDAIGHVLERMEYTSPFDYDVRHAGLILGETGTRNITVSTGNVWQKLTKFAIPAINTSAGGACTSINCFDAYYRDGGTSFTKVTDGTQWNNLQYDNNTGTLATLGASKYGVLWFYLEPDDGMIVMVYGRGEYSGAAAAEGESPPATLPMRLAEGGKLLARLIFQKSAATATSISSALYTQFSPTLTADHANLSNLPPPGS